MAEKVGHRWRLREYVASWAVIAPAYFEAFADGMVVEIVVVAPSLVIQYLPQTQLFVAQADT